MNKRIALLLAATLALLALGGCGGEAPASGDPGDSAPPAPASATTPDDAASTAIGLRLASHNAQIEGNAYRVRYEIDIQEAAEAAAAHGLDVSYASFVSNWDPSTESQQIENSINDGYDLILVNPVAATGLDPIIEKALESDSIYINTDCEYYSDKIINICTDQYYLGYKAASYAGDVLGEGGKVVLISAIGGNAANEQRDQGFRDAAAQAGLEIVGQYNHDWDTVLAQQLMTEILSSGLEFDGILISQSASGAMTAYEVLGADLPRFIGFCDSGQFMQQMLAINAEEEVLPYIVISNPPGVGASALNFGLNMLLGYELRDDIFDNPDYNSVYLESKVWYTYENQEEYRAMAEAMNPLDTISYWLTIEEIREHYFL